MVKLTLTASFPLGTYYGHRSDGSVEAYPSPLRLHAALLNAAAQGSLSDRGQPSAQSLQALRWLEKHPPTGLFQPETQELDPSGNRIAYRDVGTFDSIPKSQRIKKRVTSRPIANGVAVREPYGFVWNEVPEDIAETLTLLAGDISYLGESHSMAVVSPGDVEPNLVLAPGANCFTVEALARPIPTEGRTDALIEAYNARFAKKGVTKSRDRFAKGQLPKSELPTVLSTSEAWYEPVQNTPVEDSPWSIAYLFELEREIDKRDRVAICTAMHRAIIALLGHGAAPIITGKYNKGVAQPANRLAIQYLPGELAQLIGLSGPHLALFVPTGTLPAELSQIRRSTELQQLWSRRTGKIGIQFANITRSAARFWPEPKAGTIRLWESEMPIIPETRKVREGDREWTLGDSALLSAAYVWREEFTRTKSGQQRYIELRDQVAARDAQVFNTHMVSRAVKDYAHHSHESVPVQPYYATLDLGTLAHPQAAIMLGQSRHIGGGLLKPLDIEVATYQPRGGAE